jgi:hypothetical protein
MIYQYEQMKTEKQIWIIRVNDGINFHNSKFPIWGLKRGKNGSTKTIVCKMMKGDILCFMTSKKYGGKIIGMSVFYDFYDKKNELLLDVYTKTNKELGWKGDEQYDIQIHYSNLYITEKQNITGCIISAGNIFNYKSVKNNINGDLYEHYKNFQFYSETKIFKMVE